jgi:RNA polymerase sigma factor (sigma-70 family)
VSTSSSEPVDVLVARVRRGEPPATSDVEAVRGVLRTWLARRGLKPEDLDEVVSDAVVRLLNVVELGHLDPDRSAGAWLRVVADHLAIDALRRRGRSSTLSFDEDFHGGARDDDRYAELLEQSAAAADVRQALRGAADAGESDIVRVVTTWLGLASDNRAAPSSREVGERLGISHMTVQRALKTFGRRLSASDVPEPDGKA